MSDVTATRLERWAQGLLAYSLFVVLWGAYVRASFSGDGCGDHWPLCHGVVLPNEPSTKTLIELTHRVTSGLALVGAMPAERLAVTVHHHIPTFHTEHCVYAHLLSHGRDIKSCGQPCQRHEIGLRDHRGHVHPVVVDPALEIDGLMLTQSRASR